MKVTVSFFAIMLIFSLAISGAYYALIPLSAAALHELGHILAAKARGVKLKSFDIGIFGARLTMSDEIYSYTDEIMICAAGPLVNLVLAGAGIYLCRIYCFYNELFDLFIASSLCLGIVNLLPIKSFDGGRILISALSVSLDADTADKILSFLSFLSLFVLWCISLYLLLRTSASLSLFVFSVSLFASIFVEKT